MPTFEHVEALPGEIHTQYNWVKATEAERLAIVPEGAFSLYGVCLQTDTSPATEWRLMQVSPPTWEQVGVASVDWADVQNKPATFPPEAHTHPYEPENANIQAHIGATGNPHGLVKGDISLGNVDNTSDADKPVSTAQQTALNAKADKDGASLTNLNSIQWDTNPTPGAYSEGQQYYDPIRRCLVTELGNGVKLQEGQEVLIPAKNNTGVTITNGTPVWISGSDTGFATIAPASAATAAQADGLIGVATEDIANGTIGLVTRFGYVNDIDTSGFAPNAPVYLSTVPGQITSTAPQSPNYLVHLGHVVTVHATAGSILVSIETVTQMANSVRILAGTGVAEMNNVQDFFRHSWSSGVTDGCAITDNADGTVSIASGEIIIRETNADDAVLTPLVMPAQANISMTADDVTYLYVNYNGGSPVWQTTGDLAAFDGITKVVGFAVGRNGTTLNIIDLRKINVDFGRKSRRQKAEFDGFVFSGWWRSILGPSALSATGLNPQVGTGKYFYFDNSFTHNVFDTTIAGTALANVFRRFYNRSSWQQTADLKTVNNTQYDNAGTLTSLAANRYRTDWWYVVMCGSNPYLAQIMGNAEYTSLALAQAAPQPASLPPHMAGIAVLIGQSVVQQNQSTLTIQRAGSVFSAAGGVVAHSSTSGLSANDHPQYDLQDRPITALGTLATSATIALVAQSDTYTATTNGNTTIAFSGVPATGFSRAIQLRLTVTGTNTVTFTGALYDGGVAPTYSGSGKLDTLEIQFNGSVPDIRVSGKDVK